MCRRRSRCRVYFTAVYQLHCKVKHCLSRFVLVIAAELLVNTVARRVVKYVRKALFQRVCAHCAVGFFNKAFGKHFKASVFENAPQKRGYFYCSQCQYLSNVALSFQTRVRQAFSHLLSFYPIYPE